MLREVELDAQNVEVVSLPGFDLTIEPLATHWPPGVISLSHVALPFPPDDPLYGLRKHAPANVINLGQLEIQGERGLLIFPADWLLRLRHNPFYGFLERCTLDWVDEASGSATDPID